MLSTTISRKKRPQGKGVTMTIVPASDLSQAEILMLGTNVLSAVRHDTPDQAAMNLSLDIHGEAVGDAAGSRAADVVAGRNGAA